MSVYIEGWHYHMQGSGERNVVVIPGLNGRLSFFRNQLPIFSRYFRVLLFELPDLPSEMELKGVGGVEWMADELDGVMETAGIEKAAVIGESFGGSLAMAFALRHPERVEALVVISAIQKLREPLAMRAAFQVIRLLFPIRMAWTVLSKVMFCPDEGIEPRRFFIEQECNVPRSVTWRRWKELRKVDLEGRLNGIRTPTLITAGMKDRLIPSSDSEAIHRQILGSRLELFEDAAHLCHLTRPDRFNRLILQFLGVDVDVREALG